MKKNLDLVIILTLSLLVCGVLYLLYTDTKEYSMPKDGNIVMSRGGGSRHVALRRATNGGTWTPEVMSGGVASSRSVLVAPQTYRRSSMQATTTNSSLISSSRSLMSNGTSNSVSIVGGNNASFGRTAEANRSQSIAYGGGVAYSGVNVPSMRSSNPVVASAPSYVAIGATSSAAQYQPYLYSGSTSGVSIYGNVTARSTSTASPLRARGQFRAPTLGNSWEDWLNNYWSDNDTENDYGTVGEDGSITLDWSQAESAWNDMVDNDSWVAGMGDAATWESFLDWLQNNGGKYQYVPIGDVAPLFLLAFAYLAMLLFRRRIN